MSVVDTARTIGELVKKGATLDLQKTVVQLREEALELQEENLRLKKENLRLKEQIELQETVKRRRKVYWRDGDDDPFCPYCRETSHTLIHLTGPRREEKSQVYDCLECGIEYYTIGDGDFAVWSESNRRK